MILTYLTFTERARCSQEEGGKENDLDNVVVPKNPALLLQVPQTPECVGVDVKSPVGPPDGVGKGTKWWPQCPLAPELQECFEGAFLHCFLGTRTKNTGLIRKWNI